MNPDDLTPEQRRACARMATTLALPPELAPAPTGLTRKEEALLELHGEVRHALGAIADSLTEEFLRPALEAAGVTDPGEYRLAYTIQEHPSSPGP